MTTGISNLRMGVVVEYYDNRNIDPQCVYSDSYPKRFIINYTQKV